MLLFLQVENDAQLPCAIQNAVSEIVAGVVALTLLWHHRAATDAPGTQPRLLQLGWHSTLHTRTY